MKQICAIVLLVLYFSCLNLWAYPSGIVFQKSLLQVAAFSGETFSSIYYLPTDSADYIFYGTASGRSGYYVSLNNLNSITNQQEFSEGYSSNVKTNNIDVHYKNGYLFYLWPDKNNYLRFSYSSDGGSSWSNSVPINVLSTEATSGNYSFPTYFPKMVEVGNYLYSFWWNYSGGNLTFKYNYADLYKDNFTTETDLFTAAAVTDLSGGLDWDSAYSFFNNKYVFVFYKGLLSATPQIYMERLDTTNLPALSVKDKKAITISSQKVYSFSVASLQGFFHIFYLTRSSSSAPGTLYYKRTLDLEGDTFSVDKILTTEVDSFSTLAENNRLYVIVKKNDSFYISVSSDYGNSFSDFYPFYSGGNFNFPFHFGRSGDYYQFLTISDSGSILELLRGVSDTTPPEVKGVELVDSDTLKVKFNENLDNLSFSKATFKINSGYSRVYSQTLSSETVTLKIDSVSENSHNIIEIKGVKDEALNEAADITDYFNGPPLYNESSAFSTSTQISSSNYDNNFPFATTVSDKTYLFYFERLPYASTGSLKMAVLDSAGKLDKSPFSIANAHIDTYLSPVFYDFQKNGPQIADGKIYYLYVDDSGGKVVLDVFSLNGTLENQLTVAEGDGVYFLPEIQVTDSYIHCLYRSIDSVDSPTHMDLWYRRVGKDFSFGTENRILSGSSNLNLPISANILTSGENVYISYISYNDLDYDWKFSASDTSKLYFLKAIQEGNTWRTVQQLSASITPLVNVKESISGNNLDIYYISLNQFLNGKLYKFISSDSGESFSYSPYFITSLFFSQVYDKGGNIYNLSPVNGDSYLTFMDARGSGDLEVYFANPLVSGNPIYQLKSSNSLNFSPYLSQLSDGIYYLLVAQKNTYDDKNQIYLYYYDKTPPSVSGIDLADENTIYITFSEDVSESTALNTDNYSFSPDISIKKLSLTDENKVVRVDFSASLSPNTLYSVSISGIKDVYGNLSSSTQLSFTTPLDFSNYSSSALSGWMEELTLTKQGDYTPEAVTVENNINLYFFRQATGKVYLVNRNFSLTDKVWSNEQLLVSDFYFLTKLKVSASGSHIFVAFYGKKSSASVGSWYYFYSSDGGKNYSSPVELKDIVELNFTFSGDSLYMLYSKKDSNSKINIFYKKYSDYGRYPQNEYEVNAQSLYNSSSPALTIYNDNLWTAWREVSGLGDEIDFSASDLTPNFTSVQTIATSSSFSLNFPEILYNSLDKKLFLYYKNGAKVSYSFSYTSASNWSGNGDITDSAWSNIEQYTVLYDFYEKKYYMGVVSQNSTGRSLYFLNSYDGENWTLPLRISSEGLTVSYSSMVLNKGKPYLFYSAKDSTGISGIFYRTTDLYALQAPDIQLYTFPNPAKLEEITALIVTEKDLKTSPTLSFTVGQKTQSVNVTKIKSDTYLGTFSLTDYLEGNYLNVDVKAFVSSPYNKLLSGEATSSLSLINLKNLKTGPLNLQIGNLKIRAKSFPQQALLVLNSEKSQKTLSIYPSSVHIDSLLLEGIKNKIYLARKNKLGGYQFVASALVPGAVNGGKYYLLSDSEAPQILSYRQKGKYLEIELSDRGSGVGEIIFKKDLKQVKLSILQKEVSGDKTILKVAVPDELLGNGKLIVNDRVGNLSQKSLNLKATNFSVKSFYVYPNPITADITSIPIVCIFSQQIDKGTIKIVDFKGQKIQKFPIGYPEYEGQNSSGEYVYKIYWNGKNEEGYELANGTYFMLLKATNSEGQYAEKIFKVTILK